VSLGYDRIRFPAPVLAGDTLRAIYRIALLEAMARRSVSAAQVANQRGTICCAAQHFLKFVPRPA